MRYVVGIDEAGRGALAGPISVGAVLYPESFDWREAYAAITKKGQPKLRDSKKLSAQQRDILFTYITSSPKLRHAAALVPNHIIDSIGIVNAGNEAVALAIRGLGDLPGDLSVLLDAGLRAPSKWEQKAIVRGDETVPAISFASIIAKVTRDRHMDELSTKFREYGFEQHKGYGTKDHVKALHGHGLSTVHRRTFIHLRVR